MKDSVLDLVKDEIERTSVLDLVIVVLPPGQSAWLGPVAGSRSGSFLRSSIALHSGDTFRKNRYPRNLLIARPYKSAPSHAWLCSMTSGGGDGIMNSRRLAQVTTALCGTVGLAGWVVASLAGLGSADIENAGVSANRGPPPTISHRQGRGRTASNRIGRHRCRQRRCGDGRRTGDGARRNSPLPWPPCPTNAGAAARDIARTGRDSEHA